MSLKFDMQLDLKVKLLIPDSDSGELRGRSACLVSGCEGRLAATCVAACWNGVG